MPDVLVGRETYIMVSDGGPVLYPDPNLYPDPDLYPQNATRIGNIVEGSMDLDELLCDGELKFGQMCATKFEVTVYDTEDIGGKYLSVYQEDDGIYHQVFTGVVDSAKLDRLGTDRQVVAYDYAYTKSRINVAPWWTTFWSTHDTATVKELRDSLLFYAGVIFEDVELINDDIPLSKTADITSISFTEMLRMICELSCCFPHFNRDGELEFYMLETDATATSLETLYEGENSTFQDYTTQAFTGIQFYGNSSDLQYTEGTSVNPYNIQENILLYGVDNQTLHAIGYNMLDYISTITYKPSSVKMIVSDWTYKLGDKVSTTKGSFYILHQAFNGMQLIEQLIEQQGAEVQQETPIETSIADVITDADTATLEESVAELGETVENISKEWSSSISESIDVWDEGNLDISERGYGLPDVDTDVEWTSVISPDYEGSKAPNAKLYTPDDEDSYYLNTSNGKIYQYVLISSDTGDYWAWVFVEQATGTYSSYTPSDVGTLYLDEETGKVYELKSRTSGSVTEYYWDYKQQLGTTKAAMQSEIRQTGHSISLSVSGAASKNTGASITITLKDADGNIINQGSGNVLIDGNVIFSSQLTDGTTQISGDNITTGTISASRIDTANLNLYTESGSKKTQLSGGEIQFLYGNNSAGSIYGSSLNTLYFNCSFASFSGGIKSNGSSVITRADLSSISVGNADYADYAGGVSWSDVDNKPTIPSNYLTGVSSGGRESGTGKYMVHSMYKSGSDVEYTTMEVTGASDRRLKVDIEKLDNFTDLYMDLEVYKFKYNPKLKATRMRDYVHYGIMAQDTMALYEKYGISSEKIALFYKESCDEVQEELTGEETYWSMNRDELHALHIQMIQKQQRQIESQQKEIDSLKERLARLEVLLDASKDTNK